MNIINGPSIRTVGNFYSDEKHRRDQIHLEKIAQLFMALHLRDGGDRLKKHYNSLSLSTTNIVNSPKPNPNHLAETKNDFRDSDIFVIEYDSKKSHGIDFDKDNVEYYPFS
ncbi:5085_t:CDS:2 [Diversispora eburnea]|uniref:5085_t:CDS:1 n=1 Tax=Diversispora eburnea TaxID=1213867 RepID=A0A9N8YP51_9GLOM|nr:5085_t:CDS:2 [Diversispora eburnea]